MEMRAWDQFCKQESPEIEKYRQKQELLSIQFVKNNTQKKNLYTYFVAFTGWFPWYRETQLQTRMGFKQQLWKMQCEKTFPCKN